MVLDESSHIFLLLDDGFSFLRIGLLARVSSFPTKKHNSFRCPFPFQITPTLFELILSQNGEFSAST